MTKEGKQILENQMAIIDMLAYLIEGHQPMEMGERPWEIRSYLHDLISETKDLIHG